VYWDEINKIMYDLLLYTYEIEKTSHELPVTAMCYVDGRPIFAHNIGSIHAEDQLIKFAPKIIFISLEPCALCLLKIINAKIPYVFFGTYNQQYINGVNIFLSNIHVLPPLMFGGFYTNEFSLIIKNFFKTKRINRLH
jgi:hypothetical protein